MATTDTRLPAHRARGRLTPIARLLEEAGASCELSFRGDVTRVGEGPPAFRVAFHSDRALRLPPDEFRFMRSYIEGDVDIEGDMSAVVALRDHVRLGSSARQKLRFLYDLFLRSPTSMNPKALAPHYGDRNDFFLTFMDRRYRYYSHVLFHSDDESLEDAAEHKLESMWEALELKPGMRLLDIGGGWGGTVQYCASRGVHVTSVTLVPDSAQYIRKLIEEKGLDAEVRVEDFLVHAPAEPYDHAVIFGVIEHIPAYRRFCEQAWKVLKPGGRLYLDASATKEKFAMSPLTRRYIWHGTHTFMCLQDIIQELLFHGFEIVRVRRETHDYELTMMHWAQRLEAAREEIVAGWGQEVYRAFRMYLWGGCHALKTNRLQAYSLVAERRPDPGPRPGNGRRLLHYLGSLR